MITRLSRASLVVAPGNDTMSGGLDPAAVIEAFVWCRATLKKAALSRF